MLNICNQVIIGWYKLKLDLSLNIILTFRYGIIILICMFVTSNYTFICVVQ